jgi:hypothetical protein
MFVLLFGCFSVLQRYNRQSFAPFRMRPASAPVPPKSNRKAKIRWELAHVSRAQLHRTYATTPVCAKIETVIHDRPEAVLHEPRLDQVRLRARRVSPLRKSGASEATEVPVNPIRNEAFTRPLTAARSLIALDGRRPTEAENPAHASSRCPGRSKAPDPATTSAACSTDRRRNPPDGWPARRW